MNPNEIIYELKYTFPKKLSSRIERILDRIFTIICILALLVFLDILLRDYILPAMQILISKPYLLIQSKTWLSICPLLFIFAILLLIIFYMLNSLFLRQYNRICLTNEGMFLKATSIFSLWQSKRFYKYGSFSLNLHIANARIFSTCLIVQICDDIEKTYSLFDFKHSRAYVIVENNETQDVENLLRILRKKSKEALEKEGKLEKYNFVENIRLL